MDDIIVKVVEVRGDTVRLGFTAPPHVSIHRKEVYDEIQREKPVIENVRLDDPPPPQQPTI